MMDVPNKPLVLTASDLSEEHRDAWGADGPASRCRATRVVVVDCEVSEALSAANPPKRSLLELYGLGKEIWVGVDAQQYVDQLRSEWGDPRDPIR